MLALLAAVFETGKQPLDGVRNIRRGAAIAYGPRYRGEMANAPADAEVICVHHAAIHFDFLAFDADIGDPMLAATIRAAGNVEAQLFLKIGEALFEFLREPSSKALGFRQRELAKFRACASHGSASEDRGLHRQGSNFKLMGDRGRIALRHVDD